MLQINKKLHNFVESSNLNTFLEQRTKGWQIIAQLDFAEIIKVKE